MHVINDDPDTVPVDYPRRAPMPFKPIRYEAHTAECYEDDSPSNDNGPEMLGRVIVAGALLVTTLVVIALVAL